MTDPVRVCVVGCGAIGSLFAAHLGRLPEVEVWAYDVSRPHVDAMNASGLRVIGAADLVGRVRASTDPAEIPPCALGIVATKSEHTRGAIEAVAGVLGDAAVASVQNGLGNEEVLAAVVPRVVRGTTLVAGAVVEPGVVRYDATGGTWLGPFEPQPARADEVALLAGLIDRSGLPAVGLADARGAQWTKLLFNAGTNAIGAVTGLTIGQVGATEAVRRLVGQVIDEGRRVAAAEGVVLDADPQVMLDDAIERAYGHRASMLQDVSAHRRTEVDVLNGGIAAAGRAAGIATPLNDALVALVHGLERSWQADDRLAEHEPHR